MIDIDNLIKNAMKSKDKEHLKAYRNVKKEIDDFRTAKVRKPYTEEAEIKLLKKMVKQLQESENIYLEAGRDDLANDCAVESNIIRNLLPSPKPPEFLKLELTQHYNSDPISGKIFIPKIEMGTAIKLLKDAFPYNDGKEIANIVKQYIV